MLPSQSGLTRTCRRGCDGCDPCGACRKSYPSAVIVSGGGGGCAGTASGTYAVGAPFGQENSDNGVLIHRHFRAPYGSNVYASKCIAGWSIKTTEYLIGQDLRSYPIGPPAPYPIYGNYVTRCVGSGSEVEADNPSHFPFYIDEQQAVSEVHVTLAVGGWAPTSFVFWPFTSAGSSVIGPNSKIAAQVQRLTVIVSEKFTGSWMTPGSSWQAYTVFKNQWWYVDLAKPCPISGTFDAAYQGSHYLVSSGFGTPTKDDGSLGYLYEANTYSVSIQI